jgi:adenylate cyclase
LSAGDSSVGFGMITREIERKFLIKRLPANLKRCRRFSIRQGYLAAEPDDRHVRLRKKGNSASLTFKLVQGKGVREEREIRLTPKQFAALWPATAGRRLQKVRYEIPWHRVVIEIDVYREKNKGLVVAEVEFPNRAAGRKFKPPDWFGREVTGDKRYSNIKLANE